MKSINESIDIMNKTLVCIEELMKDVSTILQRLEEVHGPQAKDLFGKTKERKLLPMTSTKREGNLMSFTYLKLLKPTLIPVPILSTWNMNEYCAFHQKLGHKTNDCFRLKHKIQDLINGGVITKPRR
nr:hypothetical protein CFP56_19095 [Quercus suber]